MLAIPCPWCGLRDETEFVFGGAAGIAYPDDPAGLTDEAWGQYLYVRPNPRGTLDERWFHQHGCRQWFEIARDTVTNEIHVRRN